MARVGITSEILDGKLQPVVSLPEDVVLVVSRATSGPTDQIYSVSDTETAKQIFGANSPIIALMRHAYAGGADNVALYRIGGRAASIENLFGEYTNLRTADATVSAGSDLTVYAGPRTNDPKNTIIIVYQGSKIVYSNAPGQEIDLGSVYLDGFDSSAFPYVVGKLGAPVEFSKVATEIKSKVVTAFVTTEESTSAFTLPTTTQYVVQVVVTSGTSVTTLTENVDYTYEGTTVTLIKPVVKDTTVQVTYAVALDSEQSDIVYKAGEDNIDANLNRLYELYDTAFVDLEAYDVFSTIIEDLFDAPNIASGSPETADRLTYVLRTDVDDGFEYEWSTNKYVYRLLSDATKTTTDVSLAALDSNGQPIIVKQYNEVDFTHRLGMWAWTQSDIAHYVNGVVGPKPPTATHTIAVNRWIGTAPTKDIYGKITANGTGLLGNRFMAGTTSKSAGFYATGSGYPDGDPLYDSSGVIVDIGKHLSIPVVPVYANSELYSSSGITIRSSSAAYAGLLTQIVPGDSSTNVLLPGVSQAFRLKSRAIQALSEAGYVAVEEKSKGLTVYSGDLATSDNSDYDYVSTAIAITHVLKGLRDVIDPYIGKGISSTMMTALYNAIDTELKLQVTNGYINGYEFNLTGTDANSLKLPLSLQPKHELRTVNIVVSLAEQDLYSI